MTAATSTANRYAKIFDLLLQGHRQTHAASRAALVQGRYLDDGTEAHLLQVCHNSLQGSEQSRSRQPDMYRRPAIQPVRGSAQDSDSFHTHALMALI